MRRFASALSEHPLPTHAIGEVVGDVLQEVGPEPDLAVLFVTAEHVGVLEDMITVVRQVLAPTTLIGVSAVAVIGNDHEAEEVPAVSLFAGHTGPVTPVRLESVQSPDGHAVVGMPDEAIEPGRTGILLADPFSFPAGEFLTAAESQYPYLQIVGGLASAARGPGGNRLVLDGHVYTEGAVGVLLPATLPVQTVVSQGCRPIGEPFVVTRAERNVVYELGGVPALDRLQSLIDSASVEQRNLMARGLHVGIVIDEHKLEFERGDFLIRGVLGADRAVGAVAVGDHPDVGSTVQFQVRDAETADEDLRELIAGNRADGALVFTCNGRGIHLFGEADHDASIVHGGTGSSATGGMFCAGEIGPVGGKNRMHGFTASVLLFPPAPVRGDS